MEIFLINDEILTDEEVRFFNPFSHHREPNCAHPERRKKEKPIKEVKVKAVRVKPPKPEREIKVKVISEAKRKQHQKTVDCAVAVNAALELVTGLGYDLSAWDTLEQRMKRIDGWYIFCQAINLLFPAYSLRGISDAITAPNAPSRGTLKNIFDNCRESSPLSCSKVRSLLNIQE